jgi:hypothetical protein
MITLEYDALNGMALPEGMAKPFVTEFIRLNKTGDVIESGNFHDQWEPIIPLSNDNIKYNMVCGE